MKIAVFTNVLIIFLSILGFVLDNRNPNQYVENNYYSISISSHISKANSIIQKLGTDTK